METKVDTTSILDPELKKILGKVANTIRHLSIDAIQKANSGHPGLPMGCAEVGAYLYGFGLRHNPKSPSWANRDRFILSAGHGSMLLYSCLHLSGFDLSLEEIQNFRQLHSKTPGHPENFETPGVETTTGPLGQGYGNAVGQALGLKLLASRFNTEDHKIFDNKVFVLAGDGDIMEGVTSEASSLAGHLHLDNLIVLYDANQISLDGPLSESCSEDTKMRYKSYGWDVYEVDGHNLEAIFAICNEARENQTKPCLIVTHTTIGKGSPNKAGTHKVHGSPLGEEEVSKTKEQLGLSEKDFFVPQAVRAFFDKKLENDSALENQWQELFLKWAEANPDLYHEYERMKDKYLPETLEMDLKNIKMGSPLAGRIASNEVINYLSSQLPQLYGGSADLSCSDMTMIKDQGIVAPGLFSGRNIKYGVREFCMATMSIGLAQTKMITPFCGTFLAFSDYMRNAIRLSALMKEQVIYQFTHDSIFLGEDGPTHQPVEHCAALRAIPNLQFIRPADNHEVKMAWIAALQYQGPTAFALSRQKLPDLQGTDVAFSEGVGRGAYIVKKEKEKPDFTLFATGSELSLAFEVTAALENIGKDVRVVSMPCWQIFDNQSDKYKSTVVGGDLGKRVSIEAGVELGWHKYIGMDGIAIAQEGFGASAPAGDLAKEFGFTVESILERIL
ncbi:MAG: transketolase [Chlamydiales bacterium]|jgi:transketolase